MFNFIYVLHVQYLDEQQRDEYDEELYAPLSGWDAAEQEFLDNLYAAARGVHPSAGIG